MSSAARDFPQDGAPPIGMVGHSPEMLKLYRMIPKLASSKNPVLIQGENGVGKETLARAIHGEGPVHDRPFVIVACNSASFESIQDELFGRYSAPGFLESREGGTLFLDGIEELPQDLQARLMQALQPGGRPAVNGYRSGPHELRVIASSTRDLELLVRQGSFRRDLFRYLNVVCLRLPPLRQRRDDIPCLVEHFLRRISKVKGPECSLSASALDLLKAYDWPGNVRELEDCLHRAAAVASGPVLEEDDLPHQLRTASSPNAKSGPRKIIPLAEVEKRAIIHALEDLHGDKILAARLLGIGKTTLYRKLKEYGIETQPLLRPVRQPGPISGKEAIPAAARGISNARGTTPS